ncbi:hypothetical protein B0H17DRAFT_1149844 [Mycena rosella]|uniref:Uncharacterized protein n=1 Tax=Mycena rosella TaxID=1033263 RepID=A0AAD7FNF7_MYCRO|nr:hypothetical protein B0H17DRAFT_1149844 [Mycena rosella]
MGSKNISKYQSGIPGERQEFENKGRQRWLRERLLSTTGERKNPNLTHRLKVLDNWLSRSGQYPLSLRFTEGVDEDRIGELLVRYSNQIRILSVESHLGLVFGGAPHLAGVTIMRVAEGESFPDFPWHQLRELTMENSFSASELYSILDRCKALTNAGLKCGFRASELGYRAILCPQLRSLHLVSRTESDSVRILQSISLPSLVDLTLGFEYWEDASIGTPPSFLTLKRACLLGVPRDLLMWLQAWNSAVEVDLFCFTVRTLKNSELEPIAQGSVLPNVTLLIIRKPSQAPHLRCSRRVWPIRRARQSPMSVSQSIHCVQPPASNHKSEAGCGEA